MKMLTMHMALTCFGFVSCENYIFDNDYKFPVNLIKDDSIENVKSFNTKQYWGAGSLGSHRPPAPVMTYAVLPEYDELGTGYIECGTRTVEFSHRRNAKIIGGFETPYGAFPWQVEIKIYKVDSQEYEHHCGGAVVGYRSVITAAHCFDKFMTQLESFRIVTGEHRMDIRDLHEHSFTIKNVIIHPQFRKNGPHGNDIALISVGVGPSGIPFSSHVRPICLPQRSEPQGPCSVSGWGATHEYLESTSPVLRAASVPIVDVSVCRKLDVYGGRQQPILDTMICAGHLQGGVDACGGDSGGPLACERDGRFELIGLVSWGDGCAKKGRPGVYTKVHSYIHWIMQIMTEIGER